MYPPLLPNVTLLKSTPPPCTPMSTAGAFGDAWMKRMRALSGSSVLLSTKTAGAMLERVLIAATVYVVLDASGTLALMTSGPGRPLRRTLSWTSPRAA